MTSHITQRIRNVAATAQRNSDNLYATAEHPDLCDPLRAFMVTEAIAWHRFSKIILGDIGEKTREVEAPAPLDVPITEPAPQVPVPA